MFVTSSTGCCCVICLDEFEDKVRVLPCKHYFHEDCLVPRLTERHASCPLCRMNVLKYVLEIEQAAKNKNSVGDKESSSNSIETPDGSPNDTTSAGTQGSSSPRSFCYRLLRTTRMTITLSPSSPRRSRSGDDTVRGSFSIDNSNSTRSFFFFGFFHFCTLFPIGRCDERHESNQLESLPSPSEGSAGASSVSICDSIPNCCS